MNSLEEPVIVYNDQPFITVGQLLKEEGIIPTGGAAKWFLIDNEVYVNGEQDQRRGRKLYTDDAVEVPGFGSFVIKDK